MTEQRLTGRSLRAEEALQIANSVIEGRIISLGEPDLGAPGQAYYGNIRIAVLQTIKGTAPEEVTLSLTVQRLPADIAEEVPEVGQRYIIFLQTPAPEAMRGIKLLHATEENLRAVARLATLMRDR